ncbi:helix-turn-helix domain-containing protein [Sphingomonadaceae bacterium jetA1]|jgi:AcrR family transcriptional regulator|uniref:TetR/AcrR family transcriptional regulator n=1 Tax=Facivitalis istanbulensis TaxID=3075838 RepID=UPI003490020B
MTFRVAIRRVEESKEQFLRDRNDKRSAETFGRLMRATVEEVFAHGYAGATMTRIARRAGVTRGAIQHHFGDRRVDIVARVTEDIIARRQRAYETVYASTGAMPIDPRAAMKAAYRDPETWFLIEVWIAARADPDLHERVNALLSTGNDQRDREFFPTRMTLDSEEFRTLKYLLRSLTRGLALEYSRKPDDRLFDAVVDLAFDVLGRSIDGIEAAS